MTYLNRAPVISFPEAQLPSVPEGIPPSDNQGAQVGSLAEVVANDTDDRALGLAVTWSDQSNGLWQYRAESETDWTNFPLTISEGYALQLNSTSWVRFLPNTHFFGESRFTALAWDMSDGSSNGIVSVASSDEFSGPFSSSSASFSITIMPVNDPPVVVLELRGVHYTENADPVQIFPNLTITDVDDTELQSATVILECPACLPGGTESDDTPIAFSGMSFDTTSNDLILSQHAAVPFLIELVSSDSLRSEYSITPITPEGHDIDHFTQYLRTLYFANRDLEPMAEQRVIFLTVNDNASSSAAVSVVASIQLVNDEVPTISLPFDNFTYVENSGPVPLFASAVMVEDADQIYPISSAYIRLTGGDAALESIMVECLDSLICDSSQGNITVTGAGSLMAYSQVLSSLSYHNSAEEPDAAPREITFSVFDGKFTSPEVSIEIQTELINDLLPVISPQASNVSFIEANPTSRPVAFATNLTVTDPDSGAFRVASVQVLLTDPQDEGFERIGLRRNLMFPPFIEVNTSNPYLTTLSVQEDAVDMDGEPVMGLSPRLVRRFLDGLRYRNREVQPSGDGRTIQVVVTDDFTFDGLQDSDPAVITVNFELTDDLPIVELNAVGVVVYSEGQVPREVSVSPNATVQDVDNTNISSVLIMLSAAAGINISQEVLRVILPPDGAITEDETSIENRQRLVLSGEASADMYTMVLRSLTYEHTTATGDPDSGIRVITVMPVGVNGAIGVVDEITIAFNVTDNPPLLDLNGRSTPGRNFAAEFEEEGDPIFVTSRDLVLEDVDSAFLEYVRITLSRGVNEEEALLINFDPSNSSATIEQNSNYSILLLGPSPVEELASLLLTLKYLNLENEPSGEARNVTITVSDGNGLTEQYTVINIALVNDAPVISINGSEESSLVTFVEGGAAVPLSNNPQVSDSDSEMLMLRIRPLQDKVGDMLSSNVELYFDESLGSYLTNSSASPSELTATIASVTFQSVLDEPEPGDRVFCFTVLDDQELPSGESCSRVVLSFVNDSPPTFEQLLYHAAVVENAPNTNIIQVTATDLDSTNTPVELAYSIAGGDDCMQAGGSGLGELGELASGDYLATISPQPCRFAINSLSGQISTTDSPPDREQRASYILEVVVSDGTNEGRAYVNITVIDIVDEAPRFQPAVYNVTVPLGAQVGHVLAQLRVVDPDSNDNIMIFKVGQDPPRTSVFDVTPSGTVTLLIPESELDPTVARYILTYEALDSGFTPASNLAILEVNVILNNATPVFEERDYVASISESAAIGASVLTASAVDTDTGSNAEITYSIEEDADVPFEINSTSGYISLVSVLDFEVTQSYTFSVRAVDGGRISRTGTASVSVQVINENEDRPSFTEAEYSAFVCEGVPVGYEVLTVRAEDSDAGSLGEVMYQIINEEENPSQQKITVNSTTGVVMVASALDFEDLARNFVIGILAVDGGGHVSTEALVSIAVLNDNEFAPEFQRSLFEVTIPENYPLGSPLPLLGVSQAVAMDGDACDVDQCNGSYIISNETCSGFSGLTYSITGGDDEGLFAINPDTGVVSLTNTLDFDVSGHRAFSLNLRVHDGQFTSDAQLAINVTDFNDNLPMFTSSSYNVTIPELIEEGTVIVTVKAVDADPTSVILYSLSGEGAEDFSIDPNTGAISTASVINFQAMSKYNLLVFATNPAMGSANMTAVGVYLTVLVEDINNHSPIFTEPSYIFFVQENIDPGRIGAVLATDQDSGSNAVIEYSILSVDPGNSSSLFSVDSQTGVVSSLVAFDRELIGEYALVVEARDNGFVSLTDTAMVTARILDENDNPPVLSQERYDVQIDESTSVGVVVVTVNATDPDLETVLIYEITGGNDLGHFSVDMEGVVSVNATLDRETVSSYVLTIQVSDAVEMPRISTATLNVTLNDVNDNAPSFGGMGVFTISISEDVPQETPYQILDINATDPDAGSNADITYTFVGGDATPFEIGAKDGVVSVVRPLDVDRERVALYILQVVAANPDGLFSSARLEITILDVNDNSPVFNREAFSASIDEDLTPAQANCDDFLGGMDGSGATGSEVGLEAVSRYVTTVNATDMDQAGSANSKIVYSIVSTTPPADFVIDRSNGDIYVTQLLDRECFESYHIVVEAANPDSPFKSTAGLNVSVTDINDNAPAFQQAAYTSRVLENVTIQSSFLQVMAVDADVGNNAELVYFLGNNSFPFAIEETSGSLYATVSLDREAVVSYSLEVFARDSGVPSNSASASIEVILLDVNDNPPQLSPAMVMETLDENVPVGTIVVNFTVTDADSGSNALSELQVYGGSSSFAIEGGSLVVSGSLDFEINERLEFQVRAMNTEPSHPLHPPAISSVVITLRNLNDNPPIVIFTNNELDYFERVKQLPLAVGAKIIDDDGTNTTTLVDGLVELISDAPDEDPSIPFTRNTRDRLLPYDCPREDEKGSKFPPCNMPVRDDHFFTRPDRGLQLRNMNEEDIVSSTFVLDASREQYAYKTIDANLLQTGLTISTWVWFDPVEGGLAPLTIVSKASPTAVLYSVFCSADGEDLGFQYHDGSVEREVMYPGLGSRLQGAWNHLGVVLDNSDPSQWKVVVYINAEYVGTRNIATPTDEAGSVFVGTRPDNGVNARRRDFFNGRIHLLLFSYYIANQNEINCAIGCGIAIVSTLKTTPLDHLYDYGSRTLNIQGRELVVVYEEFLNSLTLVLPLLEPISSTYSISYTVQDDNFNCLPTFIQIQLNPSNDFQPTFSLSGQMPPEGSSNFSTTFVEDDSPVGAVAALNASAFILMDEDLVAFPYIITVEILNPEPEGSEEILEVTNIPPGMNVMYVDYTLSITGNLSLPRFRDVLGTVTYDNRDDEPTGESRQLLFTVADSPEEDVTAFTFLDIVLVNDVPVLNITFGTVEYSEGDGAVNLIGSVSIDDSDNTTLVSGEVSFNIQDPGAEILGVDTSDAVNIVADYDSVAGILMLTGEDTLENYMSVLQSLTYEHNNMEDPSLSTRIFFITLSDGLATSNFSSPAGMLFFLAVNDPPVIDLNGPGSGFNHEIVFIEDIDMTVAAVSPQATLIDVDNDNLVNMTITLAPRPDENETLLFSVPPSSGVTVLSRGMEFVFTSTSPAPVAVYQMILRSVQYQNLAKEPTAGIRTVEFVANDGEDVSLSPFTQITVRDVNDVPVLDIDTDSTNPGYEDFFMEQGMPVFITSRAVSISDDDIDAEISEVMVLISNPLDGLDERIISADPSVNITGLLSSSSSSFVITPADGSLSAVEDLLQTLQYVNQRNEPSLDTRFIIISVSDGTSFSNSEVVMLQVLSVNENAPRFEQPEYSRSILEELDPEVSVAVVRAVDEDSGPDGIVTYAIVSSDPPEGVNLFRVSGTSGVVYSTAALDRESVDFYSLNISASDNGTTQRTDYATLEITILDANEPPQFQNGTNFNLTVRENEDVGTLVATVVAIDGDLGENAMITYSLGGEGSVFFDVISDGRVLVTSEPLDADVPDPVYRIEVVATDNGTEPLSIMEVFTITVLDINDNSPVFDPPAAYSGDLSENVPPGSSILTVVATDIDSGSNGQISYSLRTFTDPPRLSTLFAVNETTGVVTNLITFDREDPDTEASYFVFVTATDNGIPRRRNSGIVSVTITITDENDVAPRFSMESYATTIDENVAVGSTVLTVAAVDGDVGIDAQITYSILPNSQVMPLFASSPLFTVDPVSGDILVNADIDFELQPAVSFAVEANDSALTASANVTISIRDLNDNTPSFNQSLYEASILESVPIGTVVLTVVASDADSNESGEVSYTLQDNTGNFNIDGVTGAIFNTISLDFESDCFYRLLVTAFDGGEPAMNSSAMIYVSVLSVHDVPPVFSMPSYSRSIPENGPIGSSIQQVVATDEDILSCSETLELLADSGSGAAELVPATDEPQASDSNFEFVLLNGNDVFVINSRTGLITNVMTLDREENAQYVLLVQARDPEGLSAEVNVTVNVLDQNDNSPVFTQPSYTTVMSENDPVGSLVVRVSANDADSIDQGRLVYSLRDHMDSFAINNRTGDISIVQVIDFDTVGESIDLIAIAMDTSGREAAAFVRLIITDLNDIPPVITTPPSTLTFTEGRTSLVPFPQIMVNDSDSFQLLCSATVELTSPQSSLNTAPQCSCLDTSTTSSCSSGCFEFLQLPPHLFPGVVLQSENGTVLTLVGNHSIATYESAIGSIQYINVISNPLPEPRTVSVYVFDCQLPSNTFINTINVEAINVIPPVVDLNGPSEPGTNYTTTFRERGPQVAIASPNAAITDEDMILEREELTGLDVWIANPQDGASESLVVSGAVPFWHPTINLMRVSPHFISFTGVGLLSEYTTILTNVSYVNTEDEPTPFPAREVNVIAHEDHLSSEPAVSIVQFATSNDHPPVIVTDPPRENRFTSFREGDPGVHLTASDAFISDLDSAPDLILELQVHLASNTQYDLLYWPESAVTPPIAVNRVSYSSVVFSGQAPPSSYEAVIRALAYQFIGEEFDTIFPPRFVYLEISDSQFSTFSAVQIALMPVNDQLPIFTQSTFRADISENASVGVSVIQVTAVDGDQFSENSIEYSIQAGNEGGFFVISPQNGTLYLNRTLDFEATQVHRLTVRANDTNFAGDTSATPSIAVVTVNVRDINDQVPMFSVSEYNATVGEGVPIGTIVLQVVASDDDSEEHSDLEYGLAGTTDFDIGQQDGVIITRQGIDRETIAFYSFFVTVRNPGTAAFDTARVSVTVLDLDDNPPILILDPEIGILQEPETSILLGTDLDVLDQDPSPSLDYAIVQILSSNGTDPQGQLLSLMDSQQITVSGNGTAKLVFRGESQPLDEYVSVLRGVVYQDLSSEPADVERLIAYQVGSNPMLIQPQLEQSGGEMVSNISIFTVMVSLINDNAPMLSLDARPRDAVGVVLPECVGVAGSYSVEYQEDSPPVSLSHSSLAITDGDSGEKAITHAVVEITDAQNRGFERLTIELPPLHPVSVSSGESNDFRIVLTGSASLQEYETALRQIRLVVDVVCCENGNLRFAATANHESCVLLLFVVVVVAVVVGLIVMCFCATKDCCGSKSSGGSRVWKGGFHAHVHSSNHAPF